MKLTGAIPLTILIALICSYCSFAQDSSHPKTPNALAGGDTINQNVVCKEATSSLLLNSVKEKDDWQIVSGPVLKGVHYPVQASYTKPFPSWEVDRYTADSSYFKNCQWMVLPDKKTAINTTTRIPVVFIKKFTTAAPSKLKLLVKMLYDNMAYLYIDSTWIPLNHLNPDINRFIQKFRPELSGLVSLPATFNLSNNASFYAGNINNLILPPGNHTIKIELFNNAYELGCIIKGILISDEKIFCTEPPEDQQAELAGILIFRDKKAFPKNPIADTLYTRLMQAAKTGYWVNSLLNNNQDLINRDTLFLMKGEKINVTPLYITEFYDDRKDSVYSRGTIKRIAPKMSIKRWEKTFVFNALVKGIYYLELEYENKRNATQTTGLTIDKYTRVIKVK